jgi:broad specificity phosphatase PhoE
MEKHPEYTYERDSYMWCIVRWREVRPGSYEGRKIATYDKKEDARREVYRLNGWKYKNN